MLRKVKVIAVVPLLGVLFSLVDASPSGAAGMTARQLSASLPVRAENGAGYHRDYFGDWIDADRDCRDTRQEVLITESKVSPSYATSGHCKVSRGRWVSPYDGAAWSNPSDVDIDHVVALKEAWDSGARSWSSVNRKRYANDLGYSGTLDAVTDNVNASKSDRDVAQWLPTKDRCTYAIRVAKVKYRWRLSVDSNERWALLAVLSGSCGNTLVAPPPRAV